MTGGSMELREGWEGSDVSNDWKLEEQHRRPMGVPEVGRDCKGYSWPVTRPLNRRRLVGKVGRWLGVIVAIDAAVALVVYVVLVAYWWPVGVTS